MKKQDGRWKKGPRTMNEEAPGGVREKIPTLPGDESGWKPPRKWPTLQDVRKAVEGITTQKLQAIDPDSDPDKLPVMSWLPSALFLVFGLLLLALLIFEIVRRL